MPLSLAKLPWLAQVGVFVLVAALALGGFYYAYAMPEQEQLAARQARLDTLRAEIRKAQLIGGRVPEFRAQVADLERRLESLRPVLPEQKDVGELLNRINTLAVQSNLTVSGFTSKPITTRQMYAEWPFVLQLDGTYHNLGLFLDKISKVPRIISITDLNIRAKDKQELNSTITAECTATTFVLIETAPADGAAAKGAGATAAKR
jgi:type IV pilus assembly protein PilO